MHRHPARTDWTLLAASIAAAAATAAAFTLAAYQAGPVLALGSVAALVVGALVLVRPMAGVYLAILAAPLETVQVRTLAAGLTPSETLFIASAGSVVLHALRDRATRPPIDPTWVAFGAVVAITATGMFFAADTAVVGRITLMSGTFLVLAAHVAAAGAAELRRLVMFIAFAGAVLAGIALTGAGDIELRAGGSRAVGRLTGTFSGGPNVLSASLLLALPCAVVTALNGPRWLRAPGLVAVALVIGGLMLSLSRAAIIGAAAALVVLLAWPPVRRLAVAVLVVTVLVAVFNGDAIRRSNDVVVVSQRLGTIFGAERSTNPRLRIYRTTPQIVSDHPLLGIGAGNFPLYAPAYGLRDRAGATYDHAHNLLLNTAAENGLLGLAALVWFLVLLARRALAALRRRADARFPLTVAAAAAWVGMLTMCLLDYPLRTNLVMAVLMVLGGILVACARPHPES